ncbi:hypothetical protein [Oscillatoria sp. FACHB-1406]|uniref:hypothetical protein n=1 Tax=Oscillatoria sp. FACHB-1406 TaxID=2692846 RepID=UPI00168223CA|nr:hypothetical protein [Oscillatoria sp. FACHB-1406]MBD2576129.1 hypothetical protein [Oscillatoria sp. FACHB-1406]
MSQAGIFDLPNREDSTSAEVPALEPESSELPQTAEVPAVERFEQRIAPEGASASAIPERFPRLKEADWFSLARKLRQRNRDLLKKVAELEQLVATAREGLQVEVTRSRSVETLSRQHAIELEAARTKISLLYGELEASQHAERERTRSVEQLSQQLETASDRIAALERDCALLQQRCNEQSYRVETAEQRSRELAARLECQQHRTLQFKAALDKCLERGLPEFLFESESPNPSSPEASEEITEEFTPLKTQPIQPWSARGEQVVEFSDNLPDWGGSVPSEEPPSAPLTLFEMRSLEDSEELPESDEPDEEAIDSKVEEEPVVGSCLATFESIEWEVEPSESDGFDAIFETLEERSQLPVESEELSESEDPSEIDDEAERLSAFSLERTFEVITPAQSNFPAPLVYPHRRERKHRSLATIELPNFRH